MLKWKNMQVPILPLKYAKQFYELIGRKDKVEIISNHFSEKR